MKKKFEWEQELIDALVDVCRKIESPLNSSAKIRAVKRVARGVKYLVSKRYSFVALTQTDDFCMMDNNRDVLAGTSPNAGMVVRNSLTRKQKSDLGFYPAVLYYLEEWSTLYTALWKRVGKFFIGHPEHGAI